VNLREYHCYQGDTNDCGPYAATIAANGLRGGFVYDPLETAKTMRCRWFNGATPPWAMADWLRRQGFRAQVKRGASVGTLLHNLARGRVSIVMIGGWLPFWIHWKCVEGFSPVTGAWSFVDSSYPVSVRKEDMAAFVREWKRWGRVVIEVSI